MCVYVGVSAIFLTVVQTRALPLPVVGWLPFHQQFTLYSQCVFVFVGVCKRVCFLVLLCECQLRFMIFAFSESEDILWLRPSFSSKVKFRFI